MKRKYLKPETEYINFDVEDVITANLDNDDITTYSGGNTPGTDSGVGDANDSQILNPDW